MDREITDLLTRLSDALSALGITIARFVIFGSSAVKARTADSDIDIVAISNDFAGLNTVERLQKVGLALANAHITTPVDVLPFTKREYEQAGKGTFLGDEVKPKGIEVR